MQYTRQVDFNTFAATENRVSQTLLGPESEFSSCQITCVQTPSGSGSPAGTHTHAVDQPFYVLAGTMSLEIDGELFGAGGHP
jgi:quercetin dioxygenase-like cupin family protein